MNTLILNDRQDAGEISQHADTFFSIIPGMDNPLSVPELQSETLDEATFMRKWVAKNRPCVVRGAVRHWPAVARWGDKDYWLERCDNFDVKAYPHQNFITPKLQHIGLEQIPFHSAMERLFANRDYIFSIPGQKIMKGARFEKVEEDVPGFTFLPSPAMPRWYERMRFFAYRRAGTHWHYHGIDETLMCQVKGSKKVGLLSPRIPKIREVTRFLQDESYLGGEYLDTSLRLNPYIVDVEEGDALYIPPYWHHVVVPNDGEVGFTVAFCWKSPLHILGNFSNFMVRNVYRQGMWPFNYNTLLLPFIGCYAGLLYLTKKATGQI